MSAAEQKILKPEGQVPDSLELQVAQYILDLEQGDLKSQLRGLQFNCAKQASLD